MQFGRRRFKDSKKPRQLSFAEKLTRVVASIISFLLAATLLLTILSRFISPEIGGFLPILGLVAPAVYVANVVMAIYWVIYWQWRVALPIIIIVAVGTLQSPLFIKVPLTKSYDTTSYRNMVNVMSYNVRSFYGDDGEDSERDVAKYIESRKPDIICFQEFSSKDGGVFKRNAPSLARYHMKQSDGLRIYSRYPILQSYSLFDEEDISIVSDLLINKDTVRVINNHLFSTTITADDSRYLTSNRVVRDTNRKENIIEIASRYKQSCVERAKQASVVAQSIATSPYPTIVCGDFNDTPASFTYFKISRSLNDAFVESGRDYSYTYRGFLNLLRIDYILCSKSITPYKYEVDTQALYSDHLPVSAYLKINKK